MANGNQVATAYIQLIPTAKDFKMNIEKACGSDVEKSGTSLGSMIGSKLKIAMAASVAGLGMIIGKSLNEGAELEQSLGGIETLFKDSAQKMKNLAANAYQSAGLSANEYMQQVTMFSASLLQSLKGDTAKATNYANRAIIDMSDNANKMGTDISLIQNAYQGFAKANYTMLDNLRLGYGGTKTEMARLISDASKMKNVQKELNLTVKDGDLSFGNIVNAISVMQKNLGITGTTAKEASETLSGSFQMMSASWKNFLGQMSLGNGELGEQYYSLVDTVGTFSKNLFRMIGQFVKQIPDLMSLVIEDLSTLGMDALMNFTEGFMGNSSNFMDNLLSFILEIGQNLAKSAPMLIEKGFKMLTNLVDGIINALPVMIQKIPLIVSTFARIITDNMPIILMKGAELLFRFIKGIVSAIPTLIANMPQIIRAIWDTIMAVNWWNLGKNLLTGFTNGIGGMLGSVKTKAKEIYESIWSKLSNLPSTLWELGKKMLSKMSSSIYESMSALSKAVKGIPNTIINTLKSLPSKMLSIGKDLVRGLWNGISDMTSWIVNKVKGFGSSVLNGIKDFFGIHSPSKVFEEEVGLMLPYGMANGVEDGIGRVNKAMEHLKSSAMLDIASDMRITTQTSSEYEKISYLEKIIQVLILILNKEDKEIVLNANNREIARYLREMGVVFE